MKTRQQNSKPAPQRAHGGAKMKHYVEIVDGKLHHAERDPKGFEALGKGGQ